MKYRILLILALSLFLTGIFAGCILQLSNDDLPVGEFVINELNEYELAYSMGEDLQLSNPAGIVIVEYKLLVADAF